MSVGMLGENDGQRIGGVSFFQLWLTKFVDKNLRMTEINHELGIGGVRAEKGGNKEQCHPMIHLSSPEYLRERTRN